QTASWDTVDQLGATGHTGERQAAAERLARHDQVRLDAVVLDRPHGPGASDAGLNLVVDVEDPVLFADLLQPARKVDGHVHEAAFTLHRLEHDAGDGGRVDVLLEQVAEGLERVVGRDSPVGI